MSTLRFEKKDDRKNKHYGRRASVHLTAKHADVDSRAKVPENFVGLSERLRAHGRTVVGAEGIGYLTHVNTDFHYPNSWVVRFFFRAEKPSLTMTEDEARAIVEPLVPQFEEILATYAQDVDALNSVARTEAEAEHIVKQIVDEARTKAAEVVSYKARRAALEAELLAETQKQAQNITAQAGYEGVEYESGKKVSDEVLDLVLKNAPEAAKKPQVGPPFRR